MKLLQLNQLGDSINGLKESFDNLPHTDHKDGKFRLRRYSAIELRTSFWDAKEEAVVERLDHRVFNQSEDYNKHQGGMARDFKEIENSTLQSEGMKEICLIFKHANDLIDGQEIEIHQMRVLTQEDGRAQTSPEGVHQDGYDHIAMVGINRHNIFGGELLVYEMGPKGVGHKHVPFLTYALGEGEMILLDDRKLWHNANPVVAGGEFETGHGDWFILCAST